MTKLNDIDNIKEEYESEEHNPNISPLVTPKTDETETVSLPATYKDAKNGGKIMICQAVYKFSKQKEEKSVKMDLIPFWRA